MFVAPSCERALASAQAAVSNLLAAADAVSELALNQHSVEGAVLGGRVGMHGVQYFHSAL